MSCRRTHRHLARAAADIVGFVAIILLAWYLWPAALGGDTRIVVVQGHSMEPTFQLGDALVVKGNPQPQVGDIIVFHIPADEPAGGMTVVHRIRSIRPDGTYQTQGDNRTTADTFLITNRDVIGSPVHTIPRLGRLIGLASNPTLVGLATGLIATMLLWPTRTANKPDQPNHTHQTHLREHDVDTDAQAWLQSQLSTIADIDADANAWLDTELAALGSPSIHC